MTKKMPEPIEVPIETSEMTPKEIILLMRSLGVGKENYALPDHARAWTTSEFLDACTRPEVVRRTNKMFPERTTVESWFSPKGAVPDDRRDAWHFFFHIFFSYERRQFGTLLWKTAYFHSVTRKKINDASVARRHRPRGLVLSLPEELSETAQKETGQLRADHVDRPSPQAP